MEIQQICKKVAKDLNEDINIVYELAKYQFKFVEEVMKDPTDNHDILFGKLFRFKLKPRFINNKNTKYSPYEKD